MKAVDVLVRRDFVVFTTRDLAHSAGLSVSAAAHQLRRLARAGLLVPVLRGVWANTKHPHFDAMGCVPYVLGAEQGYVSFLSALFRHGVLSQIPSRIQVATTGRPRVLTTPVGTFELFHMQPDLHREGVVWSETHVPYRIAVPEKALLDALYLSTRRGNRFSKLPELELTAPKFRRATFDKLRKHTIRDSRIASAVERRTHEVVRDAGSS